MYRVARLHGFNPSGNIATQVGPAGIRAGIPPPGPIEARLQYWPLPSGVLWTTRASRRSCYTPQKAGRHGHDCPEGALRWSMLGETIDRGRSDSQ